MLAGAQLRIEDLATAGFLGGAFLALRALGKVAGGSVAGAVAGGPGARPRWLGMAMLPQAGLALGLALLAAKRFPELSDRLIAVVVATTVIFELGDPSSPARPSAASRPDRGAVDRSLAMRNGDLRRCPGRLRAR